MRGPDDHRPISNAQTCSLFPIPCFSSHFQIGPVFVADNIPPHAHHGISRKCEAPMTTVQSPTRKPVPCSLFPVFPPIFRSDLFSLQIISLPTRIMESVANARPR